MGELYDDLEEMCETVGREIKESNEKIRAAGGKLTAGDADYIEKLTHSVKSIKTTMAMMDAEGDSYARGSRAYGDGYGSYARRRRESMRYRRAYDDGMDRMDYDRR